MEDEATDEDDLSHHPVAPSLEDATDDKISHSYKDRRKLRNPERKRHGARNQDKSKLFCRWLVQTFAQHLKCHPETVKEGDSSSSSSPTILDVAGGKGELAARLCVCHRIQVILVDPRPCDPLQCFHSNVYGQLPQFWQQQLTNRVKDDPDFLIRLFQTNFQQLSMHFDDSTVATCPELIQAVERSAVLVGLHADGATEAIVDTALRYRKPFCVVPCCVFPNFFPDRTVCVVAATEEENDGGRRVPVRTHEQFCQYLLDKDPRFQRTVLPFEGRNVAIWWDGT